MNLSSIRRLRVGGIGAALLIGTAAVAAAQQGTITGVVTDQLNNSPVTGARVILGNTNRTALTNASGRYALQAVPAGAYELRVIAVGFGSLTRGVQLEAGGAAPRAPTPARRALSLRAGAVAPAGGERPPRAGAAASP